jgi:hypothetical protein
MAAQAEQVLPAFLRSASQPDEAEWVAQPEVQMRKQQEPPTPASTPAQELKLATEV